MVERTENDTFPSNRNTVPAEGGRNRN